MHLWLNILISAIVGILCGTVSALFWGVIFLGGGKDDE